MFSFLWCPSVRWTEDDHINIQSRSGLTFRKSFTVALAAICSLRFVLPVNHMWLSVCNFVNWKRIVETTSPHKLYQWQAARHETAAPSPHDTVSVLRGQEVGRKRPLCSWIRILITHTQCDRRIVSPDPTQYVITIYWRLMIGSFAWVRFYGYECTISCACSRIRLNSKYKPLC